MSSRIGGRDSRNGLRIRKRKNVLVPPINETRIFLLEYREIGASVGIDERGVGLVTEMWVCVLTVWVQPRV